MLPWCPVPKARPGSITTATRPDASALTHGGLTQSLRPTARGGKDCCQALAHCSIGLEAATGDRPTPQKLFGRLLSPFIRTRALGPGPVPRGAPTDPTFVVSDARDLAAEKARLLAVVDRFRALGPEAAGRHGHVFFGKLTGDEWGRLMDKHLDHHLRQFGA